MNEHTDSTETVNGVDIRELQEGLQETVAAQDAMIFALRESMSALEMELSASGYARAGLRDREFTKAFIDNASALARANYLKNPLINNATNTKASYVWGRSVNVSAPDEDVNALLQSHMNDPSNFDEVYDHSARMDKETSLQCDGNLFFVFFPDEHTGEVEIRVFPLNEITDVIRDPRDRRQPQYYQRKWQEEELDYATGTVAQRSRVAYYPDWRFAPKSRPASIGGSPIEWGTPVYHVKIGAFLDWKFGITEHFSALDWARGYKEFLEDRASVARTLAKIAAQMQTSGGQRGANSAAAKLKAAQAQNFNQQAGNPNAAQQLESAGLPGALAPAGGVLLTSDTVKYNTISTGGATIHPDEGRRLLLMVAAGTQMPEIFFGDANVGNHATAKSLARPTEFNFTNRQSLWATIDRNIFNYCLLWAVKATNGKLVGKGVLTVDKQGVERVEWNEDFDPSFKVEFPELLERDLKESVDAIIGAATLNSGMMAGTMDLELTARLLLNALGVRDVDTEIKKIKLREEEYAALGGGDESKDESANESLREAGVSPGTLEPWNSEELQAMSDITEEDMNAMLASRTPALRKILKARPVQK